MTSAGTSPQLRRATVLLGIALVEIAVFLIAAVWWFVGPYLGNLVPVGLALLWALCGYAAARISDASRIGTLMVAWAVLDLFNTTFGSYGWEGDTTWLRVLSTVARFVLYLEVVLMIHVGLTLPHGHARDRATRVAVWTVWTVGIACGAATLATYHKPDETPLCADTPCRPNIGYLITDETVRQLVRRPVAAAWILLVVGAAAFALQRLAIAGARERRVRAVPTAVVLIAALLAVYGFVRALILGTAILANEAVPYPAQLVLICALPIAVLIGLIRERLDLARVSDLVRQLSALPAARLQPALAVALGDPHLELVFAGDPPTATSRVRHVTPIEHSTGTAAWLIHDRSLSAEPRLLEAVRSSVGLALENTHLHEQLRRQLIEVRTSRSRLVEAADATRRRLERDLHDGAQQRLLAIGLALQAARQATTAIPADTAELLAEAETELRGAITELRELARGIHPAILTEQGLQPAVQQLASRAPIPVEVTVSAPTRLPPDVETTAYFVISEALTNVAKHASASRATVAIHHTGANLTIEVADNGQGGAAPAPRSGLTGLADRVAALDGHITLDSPPRSGTRLTVTLPTSPDRRTPDIR